MSNADQFNWITSIKSDLDKVSPTFCLAKWTQSTILLYNGENHSCHHPSRHKIDLESLKGNPRAIHNTPIKMYARKELLDGIQTKECDYCWRIENSNKDNFSDRIYKSGAPWSRKYMDDVLSSGVGENFSPSYLEVAFESTCNLSCMYCTPDVSTQWMAEVEKHGPYKLNSITMHDPSWLKQMGKYPIHRDEYNPYIEAFWQWWPELYQTLETFRVTGGEPLLSKHTWKIFDYIKQHPNPNLEFAVNTNLCVPDKLIDQLIEQVKAIQGNVKEFKIFTSAEAAGSHADYIRYGMNYEVFISNIDRIMTELPNVRIVLMTTVNALSAFSFKDFLEDILILRAKHFKTAAVSTLGLSINYLRWPMFQDIRILPKKVKEATAKEILDYVYAHRDKVPGMGEALFYLEEIDQIERLVKYMEQDLPNYDAMLKDFKAFYTEYDQRRGLDFKRTFKDISYMVV